MPRLLCVILMCVYSVCVCADAQSASRAAVQRDYGVKLCGREFIRAVIFTCGGSRWKRADLDLLQSGDNGEHMFHLSFGKEKVNVPFDIFFIFKKYIFDKHPLRSYPSPSDRDGNTSGSQGSGPSLEEQPLLLSSSLAHLLRGTRVAPGESGADLREMHHWNMLFSPRPHGGDSFTSPANNQPSPDRRKRNFSLGLAGTCCTQGCTKHDIGRLC
ncbi:prorelaxin H1 [Brachyhypopomus gauderio]|uniref:prorelaxin H1 n=1 Tax=Brachyhypopomus gauderio TaxID=698409 RepID=UPI00404185B4